MELQYIDNIVFEILLNLLKIDAYSIFNAKLVCKKWNSIIKKYKDIFLKNPVIFGAYLHNPDVVNLFNIDVLLEFLNKQNDIYYLFNEQFTTHETKFYDYFLKPEQHRLQTKNIIVKILKKFIILPKLKNYVYSENKEKSYNPWYDFDNNNYIDTDLDKIEDDQNGCSYKCLILAIEDIITSYLIKCTLIKRTILLSCYMDGIYTCFYYDYENLIKKFVQLMFIIQENCYPLNEATINKLYIPKNNRDYTNKLKKITTITKSWPYYFKPINSDISKNIYSDPDSLINLHSSNVFYKNPLITDNEMDDIAENCMYTDIAVMQEYNLNKIHISLNREKYINKKINNLTTNLNNLINIKFKQLESKINTF